jgi:hypothetical protein
VNGAGWLMPERPLMHSGEVNSVRTTRSRGSDGFGHKSLPGAPGYPQPLSPLATAVCCDQHELDTGCALVCVSCEVVASERVINARNLP